MGGGPNLSKLYVNIEIFKYNSFHAMSIAVDTDMI